MSIVEERYEDLEPIVARVAIQVARQYGGDREDLRQQGWEWLVSHPRKAAEYLGSEEDGKLYKAVFNFVREYARIEKAQREGYDPDDDYFYSIGEINGLLDSVFSSEPWDETRPPLEGGGGGDPAKGGDRLAGQLDVRSALRGGIDEIDWDLFDMVHGQGLTQEEAAHALGVTHQAVSQRLQRAYRRVQRYLGGPRPRVDEPDPDYVGTRRVITNAEANATIRSAWDE